MWNWIKDWLDWGNDGGNWEWLVILGVIAIMVLFSFVLGAHAGPSPHPGGGLIEQ